MKWNRRSLLKACEELIQRPDFRIKISSMDARDVTGHVTYLWDEKTSRHRDIRVTLDPTQGGLIESLLHECLHVVLTPVVHLNFNTRLEEDIVQRLERELWVKTMKPEDVRVWRRLIKEKLT